jgi:transcriptional regulator with XRE-family HTH domain
MAPEGGLFWEDLARDLEDPGFLREYIISSIRIAMVDGLVNQLDEAREEANMSKAELARAIGAEPAAVRRLLSSGRKNPTLGTVTEVASALGLRLKFEKLPARERKIVTEPLRSGHVVDAFALISHVDATARAHVSEGSVVQAKERGFRAKNSSPRVRTPA